MNADQHLTVLPFLPDVSSHVRGTQVDTLDHQRATRDGVVQPLDVQGAYSVFAPGRRGSGGL